MGPIRIACAATVATMLAGCARTERNADTTAAMGADTTASSTQMSGDTAATTASSGLATSSGAPGRHLTDANGRTVYMFMKDKKNASSCVDACAAAWPPFNGAATSPDSAVKSAMIGSITRTPDGRSQTTYNGMPLYYYEDDKQAGDIKGQGKKEFGGLWYVVSPQGQRIITPR